MDHGPSDGSGRSTNENHTHIAGVPRERIDHVYRWSRTLSTEQYIEGFRRIADRTSELRRRILQAQYYSPRHTAYATQLAQAACIRGARELEKPPEASPR